MHFAIKPASECSIPELVDLLNRGFEGYFVPIKFQVAPFLNMVRKDGIDLTISRVLLADDAPVGIALLARRGWTSRLAAMGITGEARGKGAGSWLMEKLIQEAGERGEREMVLEVIEHNDPAVHLYEKCGFEVIRRLVGLTCKQAGGEAPRELPEIDIREAARLLSQSGAHDLPWQLSAESIAQLNPPARAYHEDGACIVISNPEPADIVIWAFFETPEAHGHETQILESLIANYPGKTWHVPAILPEELSPAYERAGFVREALSQWQMKLVIKDG